MYVCVYYIYIYTYICMCMAYYTYGYTQRSMCIYDIHVKTCMYKDTEPLAYDYLYIYIYIKSATQVYDISSLKHVCVCFLDIS